MRVCRICVGLYRARTGTSRYHRSHLSNAGALRLQFTTPQVQYQRCSMLIDPTYVTCASGRVVDQSAASACCSSHPSSVGALRNCRRWGCLIIFKLGDNMRNKIHTRGANAEAHQLETHAYPQCCREAGSLRSYDRVSSIASVLIQTKR